MYYLVSVTLSVVAAIITFLMVAAVIAIMKHRELNKHLKNLPTQDSFHWVWGNIHLVSRASCLPWPMYVYDVPQSDNLFVHPPRIVYGSGTNEKGLLYFRHLVDIYPKVFVFWAGIFRPFITVNHPDTVKVLLQTSEPKAKGTYSMGLPWLGDGLLLSGGAKWSRNRRLLTPAFHFDILQPYMAIYNEATTALMKKFSKAAETSRSIEIFNNVSLCTLDIICRCVFSFQDNIQEKGEDHPYVQAITELQDLWVARSLNPLLFLDFVFALTSYGRKFHKHCQYVHSVSEDIIDRRRKTLEAEGPPKSRYLDFLDILITARDEDDKGLTPLEIRNEVDTFLFEGHDTTASSISWTLYALAEHPECQRRIQEELDEVITDKDNIQWEELNKLEYLTCCIKEAMRLHTPVPVIQRQTTKEVRVEGQTVPANSSFTVHVYMVHHNPRVWDDPMEYRPERFTVENSRQRDSFAFIPFSAGPRNCIGQNFAMHEQKVVISRIINRYNFTLDPNHEVKKKMGLIMRAEDGIKMIFTPRSTGVCGNKL